MITTTRLPLTSGILEHLKAANAAAPDGSTTNPDLYRNSTASRISLSDTKMISSTNVRQCLYVLLPESERQII